MNLSVIIPSITICIGFVTGYVIGRYQATLIHKLQKAVSTPPPEPPAIVTMGTYEPPKDINETDTPVGLVESKTPQRLEYEYDIETERQGKGI